MRLSAPKKWVFWTSVALAAVGLVGFFITVPFVSGIAFWLVLAGYFLLAAGNVLKGF